jgi:uncharacterized damage-inducible protein DinB
MNGQWIYLERWRGRSPRARPDLEEFPELASVRARWEEIERDTQVFVGELSDTQLARVVQYTNIEGQQWAYPLWQQMIHQVNHGTQHRSEAAVMLTQFGFSPGWLDFLYFIDVQGAR